MLGVNEPTACLESRQASAPALAIGWFAGLFIYQAVTGSSWALDLEPALGAKSEWNQMESHGPHILEREAEPREGCESIKRGGSGLLTRVYQGTWHQGLIWAVMDFLY